MKSTKNLFSFFLSKFYDSIKYNHSFSSRLRIYFERSTKYRATIESLGNVYRNSKWTDLKVQNIKGPHLSKFIRINAALFLVFLLFYTLIFRLDTSVTYNLSSELSHVWLYAGDLFSYLSSVVLMLLINVYAYFNTIYARLLSNFTLKDPNSHTFDFSVKSSTAKRAPSTANLNLTKQTHADMSSEANLMYRLFALKNVAANTMLPKTVLENTTSLRENNTLLTVLSSSSTTVSRNNSKSFSYIEADLMLRDYPTKFIKFSANENTNKRLNTNHELSNILESSTANALSQANATRWLLRMLPISDSLSTNNSLFTSLKSKVSSPLELFGSSTNNIWLANHNVPNLHNFAEFSVNQAATSSAVIDNFEMSRLWNQKRNYLTLVPSLRYSEQTNTLVTSRQDIRPFDGAYNYALNASNLDYGSFRCSMISAAAQPQGLNTQGLANSTVFLTTANLNFWNSMDKFFIVSLCSSDSKSLSSSSYFDLLSYNTNYAL